MKKLFVFAPVVVLALFLLNSFVLNENLPKEKVTSRKTRVSTKSAALNIIFRSTDGGQTWQNISAGLPENLQKVGVPGNGFFANEHGFYLRAGNGLYYNELNSTKSFWTKEVVPGKQRNITAGRNGIFAYDFRGQFLQKTNGTNSWSPMYANFQAQAVRLNGTADWMYEHFKEKEVRAVFETANGTVFISSNNSLFRSVNGGKIWELVNAGNGTMKIAELNGVLVATGKDGIMRSTDNGQTWDNVISEGGVGLAVETINGGFAAIAYNSITKTNRVHISQDNGKTWTIIGEELQPSWSSLFIDKIFGLKSPSSIYSIKQMGKYLVCGRSDGLFRSADMGKTWTKLTLPDVENKGFNFSTAGNVIYGVNNVIYVMPNKGC